MSKIQSYFPTLVYRADAAANFRLNHELESAALTLAQEDAAGIKWCEKHGYNGYTSFASLNDLAERIAAFNALEKKLDAHAAKFAKARATSALNLSSRRPGVFRS